MTKRDYAKAAWIAGLAFAAVGETITAFDKTRGNTISETWDRLPQPAKYLVVGGLCATLAHFCWPMPAKEENR